MCGSGNTVTAPSSQMHGDEDCQCFPTMAPLGLAWGGTEETIVVVGEPANQVLDDLDAIVHVPPKPQSEVSATKQSGCKPAVWFHIV